MTISPFKLLQFCTLSLLALVASNTLSAEKTIKTHALAIHGEPKYQADYKGFSYTSEAAKKGGTMRFYDLGTFDSLNPYVSKGNSASKLGLIYDTLAVSSWDEPSSIYGLVADWMEMPEDRSWITFHINPNAKFHDGEKITAQDVVFTFNLLMEKGAPAYRMYYADINPPTALDDQRVKFTFKNLTNPELPVIVASLPVLPEHFWKDKDFEKSTLLEPLGSGPYKIGKVEPGKRLEYHRVKDYWAKDLPVNRGTYNFDVITVEYYKDFNIALEALKAGEYDVKLENISKFWATGYDIAAVEKGWLVKKEFPEKSPQSAQGFVFNFRNPMFQSFPLRKAIAYAFDFEWSNKNLFYNSYERTLSLFSNSELAFSGLPQGRELEILEQFKDQLPEAVFKEEFTLPVTDASGRDRKPLIQAKKILDAAGFNLKDGKLIHPATKKPVAFEFLTYDDSSDRIINPFIANLKKLGIEASIKRVDTSQYITRLRSFNFEVTTQVIGAPISPGNEQRYYWGSEAAKTPGSMNLAGVSDPVVDELVEMIVNAPNREELVFRTRALDRVIMHKFVMVPQWHKSSSRIVFWDKFDRPEISAPYDRNYASSFLYWWYNPEKAARIKN